MLRITKVSDSRSSIVLKLEGRIESEWISLLKREIRRCLREKKVVLDFSDVNFVDGHGLKTLNAFVSAGKVRIINCPAFVRVLLKCGSR